MHWREIFRLSTGSAGLLVVNKVLTLVSGVLLARMLGASGYGVYAFALAWIELLRIPTALGLPVLFVRKIALYSSKEQWGLFSGLLLWGARMVAASSLLVLSGGFLLSWLLLGEGTEFGNYTTFWLALVLVPFLCFTALRAAVMRALGQVLRAQIPELIIIPTTTIAALVVLSLWNLEGGLEPGPALMVRLGAVVLAFAVGSFWFARALPSQLSLREPAYDARRWIQIAFPYLGIGIMQAFNAQIGLLLVGFFNSPDEVGIYRVMVLISSLIVFGQTAVGVVTMPMMARAHAEGDYRELRSIAIVSARLATAAAATVLLFLAFGGQFLIQTIFGEAFGAGSTTLLILAAGQVFSCATGFAGIILNMTGHEKASSVGIAAGMITNVTLGLLLVPSFGGNGAAFAMTANLVVWGTILTFVVYRRLGFNATALGTAKNPG